MVATRGRPLLARTSALLIPPWTAPYPLYCLIRQCSLLNRQAEASKSLAKVMGCPRWRLEGGLCHQSPLPLPPVLDVRTYHLTFIHSFTASQQICIHLPHWPWLKYKRCRRRTKNRVNPCMTSSSPCRPRRGRPIADKSTRRTSFLLEIITNLILAGHT